MKLSNDFKNIDKQRVWLSIPYCALCGSNEGCAVHHIYGRSGKYNNSIFNGIMLCFKHHKKADNHNSNCTGDKRRIMYLRISIGAVTNSTHKVNEQDKKFLEDKKEDVVVILN